MASKVISSIVLTVMLIPGVWGIDSHQELAATVLVADLNDNCEFVGEIVEVGGEALLKRQGASNPQPLRIGTRLCRGDQVRPSEGVAVIIRCKDGLEQRFPDGVPSGATNKCPQPPTSDGNAIFRSPEDDAKIPLIISFGKLFSKQPTLRWFPVTNTRSYVVELSGGEINWQNSVSETKVVYNGAPLQPNEPYLIKVTAVKDDGSKSSSTDTFIMTSEEEAEQVQKLYDQIVKEGQRGEAEALALAKLYSERKLRADAIETLRVLVDQGSKNPDVYRTISNIYKEMGLQSLADGYENQAKEYEIAANR